MADAIETTSNKSPTSVRSSTSFRKSASRVNKNGRRKTARKSSPRAKRATGSALEEAFQRELTDIAAAEQQLGKLLPKLASRMENDELQHCISQLQKSSERFGRNLERVMEEHGKNGLRSSSQMIGAMSRHVIKTVKQSNDSRASLMLGITGLQKMLHYSIASYGSLRAWSEMIGDEDAVILFEHLTDERKAADEDLTRVAESSIHMD
jgi:ferritin-like metal-binding protein YciE